MKFNALILISFAVMTANFVQSFPTTPEPSTINFRSLLTSEELKEYLEVFDSFKTDLLPFKFFQAAAETARIANSPDYQSYIETIDVNDPVSVEEAERYILSTLQQISAAANEQRFSASSEVLANVDIVNEELFGKFRIFSLARALVQSEEIRTHYVGTLYHVIHQLNSNSPTADQEISGVIAGLVKDSENTDFDIPATEEQLATIKTLFADIFDELFGENERIFDLVEWLQTDAEFSIGFQGFWWRILTDPDVQADFAIENMQYFLSELQALA